MALELFEYVKNNEHPDESHYRCRLCYKYYDNLHLDVRHKNACAYKEGTLKKTLDKNRETILGHSSTNGHLTIIDLLRKTAHKRIRQDLENIRELEEKKDSKALEITSKMIRTVYVINKLTMSFSSHGGIVTLQKINGIDMGYHHYERTSCMRMTTVMSKTMHDTLIEQLLSKNVPISIIIDGTTDSSRIHYLIVYFQTMENDNPMIYFYRLIEVNDESSLGFFEALENAWKKENGDFYGYMHNNLVGFASDGAAVNIGKHGGLVNHLKQFAKTPLLAVHCMAHRLELAIGHSFEIDGPVSKLGKEMDKLINGIYSFYNNKGHKRNTHLKATTESLKETFYELIYIFDIRWIASNYKAMKKMFNMWRPLVIDFDGISKDNKGFRVETRQKAGKFKEALSGKHFLILFHFLFDVVHELEFWSLQLQKRSGLLIGFNSFKQRILGTLHMLKTLSGEYMILFLNSAQCIENDVKTTCSTLERYQRSESIEYKGLELTDDSETMPLLDEIREIYLTSLIEELESYFPDGNLDDFDILSPGKMPKAKDEITIRVYGVAEITNLAKYFNIDEHETLKEWQTLLLSIVKSTKYCSIKREENEALDFWSQLLVWPEIAWGENIKRLIQTVLVIPISSAEAKRGFSTLNYIRNSRRSRLTAEHLEDIMRIKLNGPDDIDKFSASKYASKWVRAGRMRTDNPQNKRGESSISHELGKNEDEEKKVYLFKSTIF